MRLIPIFIITILLVLAPLLLRSADDGAIKQLHDAQCSGCHINITDGDGSVIYTRSVRLAGTLQELESLVTHFAEGSNSNWNDEQIKAVTNYLDQTYYGFIKP